MELGVAVYQPRKLRSGSFPDELEALKPDLIVVTAYGRILPSALLTLPRLGCVNVHASLLPRWRGAAPIQWSIVQGDPETGVCLMVMDEGLDTGPVLARTATPIRPTDTGQTLHDRLSQLGSQLLTDNINALIDGQLNAQAQEDDHATHARILTRQDGLIDWNQPAQAIVNHVRGYYPWPGAHTTIQWADQTKRIKIFPHTEATVGDESQQPGSLLTSTPDGLIVQCADGAVRITEVQLEDRKRMTVADLLCGLQLPEDTVLGV